ncbi:MAG: GIY-YIG nuclease family protein [Patescibacteria group bacterium]|nr:GIY-YIG nuclease family protein [Patescibacteria group bacterium]
MRDRPCPAKRGKAGQQADMIYVYILESLKNKGYYIGISKDLGNRLVKHNKGGVRSTKSRRPFKLIYNEECENYQAARVREKEIKSYKGGNQFKELVS